MSNELFPSADLADAGAASRVSDAVDSDTTDTDDGEEPEAPPRTFAELGVEESVLRALNEMGYESPMPVQEAVFEAVAAHRDLMVQSRTGTGKTAGFGIPIVQKLVAGELGARALILAPTRELAQQVARELEAIARYKELTVIPIYGGAPMKQQVDSLAAGAQIIAGTPGRVLDHLRRGTLSGKGIETLVLDECDEMLSMGFMEEIENIIEFLPPPDKRQTLLFSATIPSEIERIAKRHMRDYGQVSLSEGGISVDEIDHFYYVVKGVARIRDLLKVLLVENPESAIIFCNTREDTTTVARFLARQGYSAEAISSDLTQRERERVMHRMREGKIRFLCATDVAARGIDINALSHVVNYTFPESPEVYVHRTGRTGRAGNRGVAISLVGPREIGSFYYLKLIYKIKPQERDLPSQEVIDRMHATHRLEQVFEQVAETPQPEYRTLAQVLWESEHGERVVAALLQRVIADAARQVRVQERREDVERVEQAERSVERPAREPESEPERENERGRRRRRRHGAHDGEPVRRGPRAEAPRRAVDREREQPEERMTTDDAGEPLAAHGSMQETPERGRDRSSSGLASQREGQDPAVESGGGLDDSRNSVRVQEQSGRREESVRADAMNGPERGRRRRRRREERHPEDGAAALGTEQERDSARHPEDGAAALGTEQERRPSRGSSETAENELDETRAPVARARTARADEAPARARAAEKASRGADERVEDSATARSMAERAPTTDSEDVEADQERRPARRRRSRSGGREREQNAVDVAPAGAAPGHRSAQLGDERDVVGMAPATDVAPAGAAPAAETNTEDEAAAGERKRSRRGSRGRRGGRGRGSAPEAAAENEAVAAPDAAGSDADAAPEVDAPRRGSSAAIATATWADEADVENEPAEADEAPRRAPPAARAERPSRAKAKAASARRPAPRASNGAAADDDDEAKEFWETWADEKAQRPVEPSPPVATSRAESPPLSERAEPARRSERAERRSRAEPARRRERAEPARVRESRAGSSAEGSRGRGRSDSTEATSSGGATTTRLYLNLGKKEEVTADEVRTLIGDLLDDAIGKIGSIAMRNTHCYVRVADEVVDDVLDALNGQSYRDRELVAERARR